MTIHHLLLLYVIWLFAIYPNLLAKETHKILYEEIEEYKTKPCSESNIEAVLSKLQGRYEEEFTFLSAKIKTSVLSPYFYFILRCISIDRIVQETKNISYAIQRNLLFLKYRYIVESHLKNCIDPFDYNFGHYKGQHKRIWNLPNKRWVFIILKNIIRNPEYPYIIDGIDSTYFKTIRVIAVDTMGDATYNKTKVINFLKSLVNMDKFKENLEGINSFDLTHPALLSLGILGQKDVVNYYINKIQLLQIGYRFSGLINLFYFLLTKIADLYVYTEQYTMAENIFKSLLPIADKTTFYNMACLYSLMGKKKHALTMLRRAIKAGYLDLRWMKKDKELDLIRNTRQFKKLQKYLEKKLKNQ